MQADSRAEAVSMLLWLCFEAAGVEELLSGLERWMRDAELDKSAEFGAKVFKISADEQGSRLTHEDHIRQSESKGLFCRKKGKEAEKVNQIRIYSGTKYETVNEAVAA